MQIIDKNGKTQIRLLLAEARRLRDAQYLLLRAAKNVPENESPFLSNAAEACRCLVEAGTTADQKKTLDKQDAREPEVAIEEEEKVPPVKAKT